MAEERIRIRDIAQELGLSTATVSNVIHGKTNKVSDETVKRVQELLEKRQYIPSMAGILLAQNSSRIIGIFVNDHEKYEGHTLDDVFIASSLNELSTEIEKRGQFMMVKKAKNTQEIISFASMWNMEGLVVIGFCEQDYQYLRDHMRIPFVVYDGVCKKLSRIVNITIDNYDGGSQIGRYFREKGHERALCISDNNQGVDKARLKGFQEGFGQECLFWKIPMYKEERLLFYQQNRKVFREVTAVFAVSDYYAIELMHWLQEEKIDVPGQVSVAGFDDIPMCEMVYPALTTVKQDGKLRAQLAMDKLGELKTGKECESEVMLPVALVERASTGRRSLTGVV